MEPEAHIQVTLVLIISLCMVKASLTCVRLRPVKDPVQIWYSSTLEESANSREACLVSCAEDDICSGVSVTKYSDSYKCVKYLHETGNSVNRNIILEYSTNASTQSFYRNMQAETSVICPDPFTLTTSGGCYLFVNELKNWNNAKTACETDTQTGGRLAEPNSTEVEQFASFKSVYFVFFSGKFVQKWKEAYF